MLFRSLKIGTVTSTSYRIEILALKNRICSAATHFPPGKGPPFGKTIAEDPRERERDLNRRYIGFTVDYS